MDLGLHAHGFALLEEAAARHAAQLAVEKEMPGSPVDLGYEPDLFGEAITLGQEFAPKTIASFRRQARGGDPLKLYGLYEEMPRFGIGPQNTKGRDWMKGADVAFSATTDELADQDNKSREALDARRVADYARIQFQPFMRRFFEIAWKKNTFGVAVLALESEPKGFDGKLEQLKVVHEVPAKHFRIDRATRRWFFRPWLNRADAVDVEPFIEAGVLHILELDATLPLDQRGLFFEVLVPWGVAQFGVRWWARYLELFGIPFREIKYTPGNKADKELAQEIGRRSGAAGWAAVPTNFTMAIHNAMVGTAGTNTHENVLSYCERIFDKSFLGHAQASGIQVGGGSVQSTATATDQTYQLTDTRLADFLDADFAPSIMSPFLIRNLGDLARKYPPRVTAIAKRPIDRKTESEVLVNAYKANAGPGISLDEAVRRLGFQPAKPGVLTLGPVGQAAPTPEEAAAMALFAASRGPGNVSAPGGVAEEILAPYRRIVRDALEEGAGPDTAMARVLQRAKGGHADAPELVAHLAAVLFDGTMRGVTAAREARK